MASNKKSVTFNAEEKVVKVPNVKPKMDAKETARLEANIANLRKQKSQFVIDEEGATRTLENPIPVPEEGKGIDLKEVPTVYFKNCKNCNFTIDHRTVKIYIENCDGLELSLNEIVLTTTIEIWKGGNSTLHLNTPIKTLQADIMDNLTVNYKSLDHMGAVVHQGVEGLSLTFGDKADYNVTTGFKEMLEMFPDSNKIVDQYIVRHVPVESAKSLLQERCIRLKNGFLSTEREAIAWERRNEAKKEAYVQDWLKNAGLTMNNVKKEKRIPANSKCPCGSGKKYKKCCSGKKTLTGVVGDVKARV